MRSPCLDHLQVEEIPVSALAYVGDAVYTLYVRLLYLQPIQRAKTYHELVTNLVRAESQAHHLDFLIDQDLLSETELALIRRGRNSARSAPRNLNPTIYQKATGFEALIGYLYLTDQPRLELLLSHLRTVSP